jgi:carbon monoxide dehydrogenase subunit G
MEFRIDAVLPATAARLWAIFFDVQRVARLIPGCENVVEVEPQREFSAVMKQKIGPFKLEVPTRIVIESHTIERQVLLVAAGSDKLTGTTIDVRLNVALDEQAGANGVECRLAVEAAMQVAGRLASLGYPIVKKRSEDLFAEFERRLRLELAGFDPAVPSSSPIGPIGPIGPVGPIGPAEPVTDAAAKAMPATATTRPVESAAGDAPLGQSSRGSSPSAAAGAPSPAPGLARPGGVELVLVWPRVGISAAVGIAVAHGAVAFGESPWWWLVAPLLGVAAGLGRREY